MTDPFGRTIRYLRVSVTDRCDLRCFYCMSEDMTFLPKADLLTLEELDRLCSAFIAKGVRKIRLTGGEPLVRRNVMSLVRSLSRHLGSGALDELTLTTNGSQLARFATELRDAGVRRINVSLDTLDPAKFRAITRWGDIDKVLAGIEAARAAGLAVKINAVALKNMNEEEIPALMQWAHGKGMALTLIEVMPMGDVGAGRIDQYVPLSLLRARLGRRNFAYDFIGRVRVRIPDDSNRDGTIVRPVRRRHLCERRCNSRQRQDGKDQLLITTHASSHQSAGRPIISRSFLPRCHPEEKMACRRLPRQARKRAGDCSPALYVDLRSVPVC
jgi:molybdenum cofactor biosynthesis enzyme MoaA